MTQLRICLFATAAAVSLAAGTPAHAGPAEMIQQMDPAAPKYDAPECKEVREGAARPAGVGGPPITVYQSGGTPMPPGAAYAIGGIAIIMIIGAAQEEARREEVIANILIERCGEDAFIPYFRAKAEKGNDDAAAWLGTAYAHKQDWPTAIRWYQAAVDRDNAEAETGLGTIYSEGNGVPADRARAAQLWQKAAGHGVPEAQRRLGQMYAQDQNYAKAADLYEDAAKHRDRDAAFYLAQLYEQGLGVARSDRVAFGWYSMATLGQYAGAEAKRAAVAARLSTRDLDDAIRDVEECYYYRRCRF